MPNEPSGVGIYSLKIRDMLKLEYLSFLMIILVRYFLTSTASAIRISPWRISPDSVFRSIFVAVFAMCFIAKKVVSVTNSIYSIFRRCAVSKVFNSIVKTIAIQMTNLLSFWSGAIGKEGHKFMNIDSSGSSIDVNDNAIILSASATSNSQGFPVTTLPLYAGDYLMSGRVKLVSWSPRYGKESFMVTISRLMYVAWSWHDSILAGQHA